MAKNPLHTKLCDMLEIEFPVMAFTHCKDVVVAVVNAGGFACLGEAMHPPERISQDINWIRERVGGKPFGVDLVLPSSAPPATRLPTQSTGTAALKGFAKVNLRRVTRP